MNTTSIKATVAALLLAPVLAFAATEPSDKNSFSYTATLTDVGISGPGVLTFNASWTDLVADYTSKKTGTVFSDFQASSLNWTLVNNDPVTGKAARQSGLSNSLKGSFKDSVIGPDFASVSIDESKLYAGTYTLTLTGNWNIDGEQKWALSTPGSVQLAVIPNVPVTPLSPVPEPESYAMMLAGLGLMGTIAVRRKSNGS